MSLQDYTLFDPCKIIWYKATIDSIFLLKNENFKCHPKQGPDDLVTFPALDATVEFIKLLCLSFMIVIEKKTTHVTMQKQTLFYFLN